MPDVVEEANECQERSDVHVRNGRTPNKNVALTKRTTLLLPPSLPMEAWSRIGRQIFSISESSAWWLGDWLIYGQSQYPDRYKRAVEETSLDYQTLRNYAWVARRFATERRRDELSFQHHAELASLSEPEQDRWLELAARSRWSRTELRKRVRASRLAAAPKDGVARTQALKLKVNVPPARKQLWQDAAATSGQDLLGWIVAKLDEASSDAGERPTPQFPT